ncbi:MAG: MarR family transcriptional regulator [Burkholderiaceae bacterium]
MRMATRAAKAGKSTLEESFGRKLVLLYNLYTQPFFEQIGRPEGINLAEWLVIYSVARQPHSGASDIIRMTGLHKTTISRVLAQLRTKGYIRQHDDPDDGRARILSLTAAGAKIVERRSAMVHEWSARLTSGLTAAEKREFGRMLDAIIETSRARSD